MYWRVQMHLRLVKLQSKYDGLTVVVTPDTKSAVRLSQVLPDLTSQPVQFFPDWETLPYDSFSPHQEIISSRLSALFHLQNTKKGILFYRLAH